MPCLQRSEAAKLCLAAATGYQAPRVGGAHSMLSRFYANELHQPRFSYSLVSSVEVICCVKQGGGLVQAAAREVSLH